MLKSHIGEIVQIENFSNQNQDARTIFSVNGEGIITEYNQADGIIHLEGFFELGFYSRFARITKDVKLNIKEIFQGSNENFLLSSSMLYSPDIQNTIDGTRMYYLKVLTGFTTEEETYLRRLNYKQDISENEKNRSAELEKRRKIYFLKNKKEFVTKLKQAKGKSGENDLF